MKLYSILLAALCATIALAVAARAFNNVSRSDCRPLDSIFAEFARTVITFTQLRSLMSVSRY
jgi:hypothetical protein